MSVYERITSALNALSGRKRRLSEPTGAEGEREEGNSSPLSLLGRPAKRAANFKPWDQQALHQRLETYRPLTWFAKPTSVSPVVCASKGWTNQARDQLCCEFCSAKLLYPQNVAYDQKQAAADLFAPLLTKQHTGTCPWRSASCNESLLAYTPAPSAELTQAFSNLQGKLLKVDMLPELDLMTITQLRAFNSSSFDEHVLGGKLPTSLASSSTSGNNGSSTGATAAAPTTIGAPSNSSSRVILQPSKLTLAQKASLLALLGWDVDVLPSSQLGATPTLLEQSSAYSLQHLVGKRKPRAGSSSAVAGSSSSTAAGSSSSHAAAAAKNAPKHPMTSVVLTCHHCNSRVGLWNFTQAKPCPTGTCQTRLCVSWSDLTVCTCMRIYATGT